MGNDLNNQELLLINHINYLGIIKKISNHHDLRSSNVLYSFIYNFNSIFIDESTSFLNVSPSSKLPTSFP